MKTVRKFFSDVWLCLSNPAEFAHTLRVRANRSAGAKRGWQKRKARQLSLPMPEDIQ